MEPEATYLEQDHVNALVPAVNSNHADLEVRESALPRCHRLSHRSSCIYTEGEEIAACTSCGSTCAAGATAK
jgi:hypothetical protein